MNKVLFGLCLTVMTTVVSAQKPSRQGLQIGDTVPKVFFGESLQDNLPFKSMADLKGKLIILDFWQVGCISCVLGMPKLDTLQQMFGEKIQTIIVCKDNRKSVERAFKTMKKPFPKTPIVLQDSILKAYFPHVSVPHHVWIDGNGVVKFITYDHNATVDNVRKFLNGEPLHLSLRKQITDYDGNANLYDEGKGRWNDRIKYHTLFATYLNGVEDGVAQIAHDSASNSQTLRIINNSYLYLFMVAYNQSLGGGLYWQKSRWSVETREPVYFLPEMETDSLIDQWKMNSTASYEAVLPGNNDIALFQAMQRDLNIYSPYFAQVEKRRMKCLILVNKGLQPTSYKGKDSVFVEEANKSWVAKNYTIQTSVYSALTNKNAKLKTPFLDETNFTAKTDVYFSVSLGNLSDPGEFARAQEELHKNGLGLEYGYRDIDMLVIRDRRE